MQADIMILMISDMNVEQGMTLHIMGRADQESVEMVWSRTI